MKIYTEKLFKTLKEYRERKLELAENDSDEKYYVETEVLEMQNTEVTESGSVIYPQCLPSVHRFRWHWTLFCSMFVLVKRRNVHCFIYFLN